MLYVVLVSGWCKVALAESDVMCHGNEQQIKKAATRVKREKFLSKFFNKFSFALSRCDAAVCGANKVILILKNVQKRAWNAIQSVLAVAMEETKFETPWKNRWNETTTSEESFSCCSVVVVQLNLASCLMSLLQCDSISLRSTEELEFRNRLCAARLLESFKV